MDDKRAALFPDVPTMQQAIGVSYSVAAWRGIAGPKGLPADVQTKLIATIQKIAESKEWKDFAASKGYGTAWAPGAEFGAFMLEQYLPILLFILVGLTVGAVLLTVGTVLSPNRPDPAKLSPYECGFEAFEDARMKFDVRYYLVAILFILFDLEIAFLFP